MGGYTYEPLPAGAFIRVLRVDHLDPDSASGRQEEEEQQQQQPVCCCSFSTVCLDGDIPEFTAVSYTWDHPPTPVSSIAISNNDSALSSSSAASSLPLSQTLHGLFKELRARSGVSVLWIDALCIDQSNPVERAAQVALMGRVFSRARHVMIWLGPSTAETHEAFCFVNSMQHLSWPGGWDGIPEAESGEVRVALEGVLSGILARPWFRRIWVIQEAALNREVTVVCGGDRTGVGALQRCVLAAWKFVEDWEPFDTEPPVLGLWCATRLFAIRDEFLERGSVCFERLLQQAYCCDSTDKRDAVFAFLGLADKKLVRALPAPDYAVPVPACEREREPAYDAAVQRVYHDAAVALLCHGESLDALALGGIALGRRDGVPSWVPDLRYLCFEDPFTIVEKACWDAGGPMAAGAELVAPGKLKVRCSVFDTVETTCAVFERTSVPDHQEAMREVLVLAERLLKKKPRSTSSPSFSSRTTGYDDDEQAGEEEKEEEDDDDNDDTWLDRLASILMYGLAIDGGPMGPEYRGLFDAWLRWLQTTNPADADFAEVRGNAFHRALHMRLESWRVFGTRRGAFCIGSMALQVGDKVCIVPGCRFPLVVRTKPDSCQESGHPIEATLIYWCYVDGLMEGGWLDSNPADVELILC
ncbi:heterokaryon incompatibility protein-domain-containing protein [Xylaria sp. FL1042]|nr:heterokaryon incompatibility protein-domain-containing protein [Xylaria sp. FL1042]